MPFQMPCPGCAAPLMLPEKELGRAVRCPKCGTAFGVPLPAEPPPPPELPVLPLAEEPLLEPLPDQSDLAFGEMRGWTRPRRPGRWGSLRAGFLCLIGASVCVFLVGVSLGLLVPTIPGKMEKQPEERPLPLGVDGREGLEILGLFAGCGLSIVGMVLCCMVPEQSGGRPIAIPAAALNGVSMLMSLILPMSLGGNRSVVLALGIVLLVVSVLGTIFWLLFLGRIANHFGSTRLLVEVIGFAIGIGLMTVAAWPMVRYGYVHFIPVMILFAVVGHGAMMFRFVLMLDRDGRPH